MTTTSAPRTARERARAELTSEIKQVARRQLAEQGSAALSLRAVARELGMVSSAVYRYFPSRDELLTALIIDAYDAVADAADEAETAVARADLVGRWMATCRAVRAWAVDNPQEYALIFGSPIPGYAAPQDTIDPAARIPALLLAVLSESVTAGRSVADPGVPLPRAVRRDLKPVRQQAAPALDDVEMARAITAWTLLIGSISFELFGHLHNVIHDYEAHFDFEMLALAHTLGLDA
ncbi:MAG: TetR/AcrR family transcriptional regulator [Acidimicrobiales bacterium]